MAARRVAALGMCGLLAGLWAAPVAHAEDVAFKFTDSRITECSGMATDAERGYYWTINDTETSAGRIYGVQPDGQTITSIRFTARTRDTEALAYMNGVFYVADIGDNTASRDNVSIFVLRGAQPGAEAARFTRYRFSYPDGARDAEGIFVTKAGRIHIVSKEASGGIYQAPERLSTTGVNKLTKVGKAPTLATDATLLADGRIAIRTYSSVSVIDPKTYAEIVSAKTPTQKQGESITPTIDGKSLLLGSEGQYSQVLRIPIPVKPTKSPTTAPSPTPTEEPGPTLGDTLLGTRGMLVLGGVVAVAAALVVFLKRK